VAQNRCCSGLSALLRSCCKPLLLLLLLPPNVRIDHLKKEVQHCCFWLL
jgi:hypothetical protein